jgi:hypothetical protein
VPIKDPGFQGSFMIQPTTLGRCPRLAAENALLAPNTNVLPAHVAASPVARERREMRVLRFSPQCIDERAVAPPLRNS